MKFLVREIPERDITLASVGLGIDCRNSPYLRFEPGGPFRGGINYALWEVTTSTDRELDVHLSYDNARIYEDSENLDQLDALRSPNDTVDRLFSALSEPARKSGIECNGVDRRRIQEIAASLQSVSPFVAPSTGLCAQIQELTFRACDAVPDSVFDKYLTCARVGAASLALSILNATARSDGPSDFGGDEQSQVLFDKLVEILVSLAVMEWRHRGTLERNETLYLVRSLALPDVPPQSRRSVRRTLRSRASEAS